MSEDMVYVRTKEVEKKKETLQQAVQNPLAIYRELNNRSFYHFLRFFWPDVSSEPFSPNWHIPYLCGELQQMAENMGEGKPKLHDLLINIPPGTTKTVICSIMFPVWCWTRWYDMRFITLSYSEKLSLESAEYSRDLIRCERFRALYPELSLKEDKDTKSNYRIVKRVYSRSDRMPKMYLGGNRYSTSVGGTLMGFHGHWIIWDDAIDPRRAISPVELESTNTWIDQTLVSRKVDKKKTVTIGIMQRLHREDPSGHWLEKQTGTVKHICLPGEILNYPNTVKPPELEKNYVDGLLDPNRLSLDVLDEMKKTMGQYSYSGQIGQSPTPPSGGMFKVDKFGITSTIPPAPDIEEVVRYWDKAGTKEKIGGRTTAAYTVGTKMAKLKTGKWLIMDVVRGRWSSEERERMIRNTAEMDGPNVRIYYEQEPGSGGKESAEATTRNLAGFVGEADRPKGDKVYRADPYSVQVNDGNVWLLQGEWIHEFIEEHRFFPFSIYKDQVDSAAGAFAKLTAKRVIQFF
jgi:predicted phage terminase large subunit-like protein